MIDKLRVDYSHLQSNTRDLHGASHPPIDNTHEASMIVG